MSDYNKILAFQSIMPYLTLEQQQEMANVLGMSLDEINERLKGKEKEDEFILILLMLGVCESITPLDEGISQILGTASNDVLVKLKNGKKLMLEIKHTDKMKYSISKGNLDKRIQYATDFGLELYFAISIMGYWMLFDSQYISNKGGKIDISDYMKSQLDNMLGCLSYIFPSDTMIRTVYSKVAKKTLEICNNEHGMLVSYELYYKNARIFRSKGNNSQYSMFPVLLSALQDRASVESQEITHSGEFTIIIEKLKNNFSSISEYMFLLAIIQHMVDDNKEKYSPHKYLEHAKVERGILGITPEHIRQMMWHLGEKGIPIMYTKNMLIYAVNPRLKYPSSN